MSEILDCDPNKGFVAFPVALFDLDLSPGAFRTLAELCRMANAEGQCWPSLAQLGRRLGRSRASVSAYIAELRAADVLRTEEQRMANGYNYRLRYTVTFWKEWRAGLGAVPKTNQQLAERRVQPVERPLRTKNHNHSKQQSPVASNDMVEEWKTAVGRAPYPQFSRWPSESLLKETEAALSVAPIPTPIISADIDAALMAFTAKRGLEQVTPEVSEGLRSLLTGKTRLDSLMTALEDSWQDHWKKPPNLFQLTRMLKAVPTCADPATEHKLLKSYLRRWKLHQRSLPSPAIRSTVAA